MEVVMQGYTKFENSKMKFDPSKINSIGNTMSIIPTVEEYNRITVRWLRSMIQKSGKGESQQTGPDLTIAEAAILTLWGQQSSSWVNRMNFDYRW